MDPHEHPGRRQLRHRRGNHLFLSGDLPQRAVPDRAGPGDRRFQPRQDGCNGSGTARGTRRGKGPARLEFRRFIRSRGAGARASMARMWGAFITTLFVLVVIYLAYRRLPLRIYTLTFTVLLALYLWWGKPGGLWQGTVWVLLAMLWLLNIRPLRKALISRPFLRTYLRLLPVMSDTEREALDAGTVWGDGELFSGNPDWAKLSANPPARLSAEEQAFLDGPCEELCRMLDDFDITHRRGDLPPAVWEFLKSRGFFAMIISKAYGGLQFSAYAHSCVLVKLASRSVTCASTVAGPNSLGPAELLNHYGTEEEEKQYLPPLARGIDIPCFALTGPRVGSDAAALPDTR